MLTGFECGEKTLQCATNLPYHLQFPLYGKTKQFYKLTMNKKMKFSNVLQAVLDCMLFTHQQMHFLLHLEKFKCTLKYA